MMTVSAVGRANQREISDTPECGYYSLIKQSVATAIWSQSCLILVPLRTYLMNESSGKLKKRNIFAIFEKKG